MRKTAERQGRDDQSGDVEAGRGGGDVLPSGASSAGESQSGMARRGGVDDRVKAGGDSSAPFPTAVRERSWENMV